MIQVGTYIYIYSRGCHYFMRDHIVGNLEEKTEISENV